MEQEAGFPSPAGISMQQLADFNSIASFALLDAEFGSAKRVVAFAGELPQTFLDNIYARINTHNTSEDVHMWSYHGHRHPVYAIAEMFGVEFALLHAADDTGPYPKGAIPPATTIFLEFHGDSAKPSWATSVVRTFVGTR
jgi:hypothetical protein